MKDWPESIANAWIDFERDEGTVDQVEWCEAKTSEKIDKVMEERRKEQELAAQSESFAANKKAAKRKSDDSGKWKHLGSTSAKIMKPNLQAKSKLQENPSGSVGQVSVANDKTQQEESKSMNAPPPGFQIEHMDTDDKDSSDHAMDTSVTVFVSNLDYTATEDEVRDALKSAGPITSFKMMKDYKGRSKGYCSVQLSSAVRIILDDG